MRLPKLNVKLLNRIKKHLEKEPKRYNQRTWGETVFGEDAPACNTQGCIAGWAVFLSVPKKRWSRIITYNYKKIGISGISSISERAKKLLGLTEDEAHYLFAAHNQTNTEGPAGVKDACFKIDALIGGRRKS